MKRKGPPSKNSQVIDRIEQNVLSGDYEKRARKRRTQTRPNHFIEETSKEYNVREEKKKGKKSTEKKRKCESILDDSDDDSISQLKSKYVRTPKKMGNKRLKKNGSRRGEEEEDIHQ